MVVDIILKWKIIRLQTLTWDKIYVELSSADSDSILLTEHIFEQRNHHPSLDVSHVAHASCNSFHLPSSHVAISFSHSWGVKMTYISKYATITKSMKVGCVPVKNLVELPCLVRRMWKSCRPGKVNNQEHGINKFMLLFCSATQVSFLSSEPSAQTSSSLRLKYLSLDVRKYLRCN